MKTFLWNLVLALAWAMATGAVTLANLAFGFGLGFIILAWAQRHGGSRNYRGRCLRVAGLILFFFRELLLASLRVAHDAVTPRHRMRAGIVAVPLAAQTDAEIALLSTLLTLTPGTLVLDISSDRRVMYVHEMYMEDAERFRRQVKEGFERRIIEALR